ncbi:hypothetical protein HZU75_05995 [Chitinibacter fontanus]|uniref:DUF2946 family protein n=1 Tax=Chitinibacter fontanus TaxID=1737446 RepID=A0A7D5V930_9NEIS|nr:hypothetical protein [Chitinibacter fontanus]QLI81119.1 hypothetical protein HZU75_05995 [Chitinibacter fontanus]
MRDVGINLRTICMLLLALMLAFAAAPASAATQSVRPDSSSAHCVEHKSTPTPQSIDCLAHCALPAVVTAPYQIMPHDSVRIAAVEPVLLNIQHAPPSPPPRLQT